MKSAVCQDTFDSLPRIYGSIKHRIVSNKMQFYEQLQKQSNKNISKAKEKSLKCDSNRRLLDSTLKKEKSKDAHQ